jgi:hypothetical protein
MEMTVPAPTTAIGWCVCEHAPLPTKRWPVWSSRRLRPTYKLRRIKRATISAYETHSCLCGLSASRQITCLTNFTPQPFASIHPFPNDDNSEQAPKLATPHSTTCRTVEMDRTINKIKRGEANDLQRRNQTEAVTRSITQSQQDQTKVSRSDRPIAAATSYSCG